MSKLYYSTPMLSLNVKCWIACQCSNHNGKELVVFFANKNLLALATVARFRVLFRQETSVCEHHSWATTMTTRDVCQTIAKEPWTARLSCTGTIDSQSHLGDIPLVWELSPWWTIWEVMDRKPQLSLLIDTYQKIFWSAWNVARVEYCGRSTKSCLLPWRRAEHNTNNC